jgi:hypothetical protein
LKVSTADADADADADAEAALDIGSVFLKEARSDAE